MNESVRQFIQEWSKRFGYSGEDDFWDFFYDMKSDVQDSTICAEKKAKFECDEDFDDWYDNEFYEIAKPIMVDLFGYSEEEIERS